jgi:tRNA(Ile)-lysidine synthase
MALPCLHPLALKTLSFIRNKKLFIKGARVLIGVSGGPDSVVLFHILNSLKHELGILLKIAHFDHKLRQNSAVDLLFVKTLAKRLAVPFIHGRSKTPYARTGSIEEAARERRYRFFLDAAASWKADAVALGHNRDDQAETVLMRILRGTGTSGLRAILPARLINGKLFVRPLLEVPRSEIETYLSENKLEFLTDPTNCSMDFFRNRIRHRIIPFLDKESGQDIRSHLAALAFSAADEQDLIDENLKPVIRSYARFENKAAKINLADWGSLHPALGRALLRYCIGEVKGNLNSLTLSHVQSIENLIRNGATGSQTHLCDGVIVRKKAKFLLVITVKRL